MRCIAVLYSKLFENSIAPHTTEYRYNVEKRLDSRDKRFDKMELQIEKVGGNQGKQVGALIGILFMAVVATSIRFALTALP